MPHPDTIPNPINAPTTECVDDTGRPHLVATAIHTVHPTRTEHIPSIYETGAANVAADIDTTPDEIVFVTVLPNNTAPANSITAPIHNAVRIFIAPVPTDVPKELATSLAPNAALRQNATAPPTIINSVGVNTSDVTTDLLGGGE